MKHKVSVIVIIFFLIGSINFSCHRTGSYQWIETTDKSPWANKSGLKISNTRDSSCDAEVYPSQRLQIVDGFGVCFNELGWDALQTIDQSKQKEIMRNLFDTLSGLKLNICRMPIGANDYSRNYYSLDDSVNDFSMKYFNISRDRKALIPYIKQALVYNPALRIWGSPWCPPAWMKTNLHYACQPAKVNDLASDRAGMEGCTQFRMEEKYLRAYASYFSNYISAYRKAGIPVISIHVQNEMNSCQSFPSCIWTAKDLNIFIGKYLGPQIRHDFPDIQIWYGTVERPWVEKIDTIMNDAETSGFITGVGFQWAGKEAIPGVHVKYPGLKLMQTETECGDGANNWASAEYTFSLMKHYFKNGVSVYSFWNPILDETGKSQWGWKQNSMISINSMTHQISYNPEYYLLKHFSRFIKPGAVMLKSNGRFENLLAFFNPDGKIVLVAENTEGSIKKVRFRIGIKIVEAELSPKSFHTIVIDLNR